MKFDLKSVVVGLVLGALLALVIGAGEVRDSAVRWGLIVPANNKALVRSEGGGAFLVDINSGEAVRVEYDPTKTTASKAHLTLSRP